MFKWYRNIRFNKEKKKYTVKRSEIIKSLKDKSKRELITMVAILGQENIILRKEKGLL